MGILIAASTTVMVGDEDEFEHLKVEISENLSQVL